MSSDAPTPGSDESVGYREGSAAYDTMMNIWGETAGAEPNRESKGSKRMLSPATPEDAPGAKRPQAEDSSEALHLTGKGETSPWNAGSVMGEVMRARVRLENIIRELEMPLQAPIRGIFEDLAKLATETALRVNTLEAEKAQAERLISEKALGGFGSPRTLVREILTDDEFLKGVEKRVASGVLATTLAMAEQGMEEASAEYNRTLAENQKALQDLEELRSRTVGRKAAPQSNWILEIPGGDRVVEAECPARPAKKVRFGDCEVPSRPKSQREEERGKPTPGPSREIGIPAPMPLRSTGIEMCRGRNMRPESEEEEESEFTLVQGRRKKRRARKRKKQKTSTPVEGRKEKGNERQPSHSDLLNGLVEMVERKLLSEQDPLRASKAKETYVTIKGQEGWNPRDIWKLLPEDIRGEAQMDVDVVKVTYKKDVLVRTKGPEEAKRLIGWDRLREKGLTAQLANKRKPRLEIMRVPSEWSAEMLEQVIWEKLATRGFERPAQGAQDWMRACFSNWERSGLKRTWVLEVHPRTRMAILLLDSISGGWWNLQVRDYIDPPLCLKCQGYGHTKAHCKDQLTCRWCGEEGHIHKECPKRSLPPECRNCKRSGKKSELKHCAGSRECPVHLSEMRLLAKRTNYD